MWFFDDVLRGLPVFQVVWAVSLHWLRVSGSCIPMFRAYQGFVWLKFFFGIGCSGFGFWHGALSGRPKTLEGPSCPDSLGSFGSPPKRPPKEPVRQKPRTTMTPPVPLAPTEVPTLVPKTGAPHFWISRCGASSRQFQNVAPDRSLLF